jgi:hypothetical protein
MAESFDQQEPLTVRLAGLLTEYPPGISTLKELLQNADDAGAKSIVSFLLLPFNFYRHILLTRHGMEKKSSLIKDWLSIRGPRY